MSGARLAGRTTPGIVPPIPPIDPRIHARLIEVRRARGRRRRRVGVAVIGGLAVIAAGWAATRSPLLAVKHVAVSGSGHTSRAVVLAASGLDHHRQMVDVGPGWIRAQLEALPWVAQAGVTRRWPNTVAISISERVAVARSDGPAGQGALLDAGGRVLATGPEAAAPAGGGPGLPQLVGVARSGPAGSVLDPGGQAALALAVSLPRVLAGTGPVAFTLRSVVVGPNQSLRAVLSSGLTVVFGSVDQLAAKLVAVQTVLQKVNLATVGTVDVRVPDTPVLTQATAGSMVSTIPRG